MREAVKRWAWSLAMVAILASGAGAQVVHVLPVKGGIDPAVADYVTERLRFANSRPDTEMVVIQMDTPGGLSESMDRIVQGILASKEPVCVFVAPAGARAASAGAIIALAAHVVAMAPATNMGAATPIEGLTGGDLGEKIKNDAAARARSLAKQRNRPVDWAERMILKADSITVDEAIQQGIADVKADDLPALLKAVDGRRVAGVTLDTDRAKVATHEMPFGLALLHLLANPNVAYLLMLVAIYGILSELSHPGAVFPGVAGAICGLLAFYRLSVLSVNVAGLLLIILAVGLFAGDLTLNTHGSLALGGAVAFVLGSLMLIRSSLSTISPYLITGATIGTLGFVFGIVSLAIKVRKRPVAMGREAMIGRTAIAKTPLPPRTPGQVLFEGSIWNAVSSEPVEVGETVEGLTIEGLMLTVRPVREWDQEPNIYASK